MRFDKREPHIGDTWKTSDDTFVVIDFQLSLKRWLVHESAKRNAPAFVVSRAQLTSVWMSADQRAAREPKSKCYRIGDPVWVGTTEGNKVKGTIIDISPEWTIVRFKDDTRWQQNRTCFPCYAVKPQHVTHREHPHDDDVFDCGDPRW